MNCSILCVCEFWYWKISLALSVFICLFNNNITIKDIKDIKDRNCHY